MIANFILQQKIFTDIWSRWIVSKCSLSTFLINKFILGNANLLNIVVIFIHYKHSNVCIIIIFLGHSHQKYNKLAFAFDQFQ